MSNYAMLDEAWSEPLMIQNNVGIFTENNTEKYQRGSYQRLFNNVPDFKKYNFESKPNVIKNKLPTENNNINDEGHEDYNLTPKKEEVQKIGNKKEGEEKLKCNPEDDPKFQELQNYVKDLESEIKGFKIEKMKKSQSVFGNVNSNEMIIFISFGVLIIMVLDSFSRLGAKMRNK